METDLCEVDTCYTLEFGFVLKDDYVLGLIQSYFGGRTRLPRSIMLCSRELDWWKLSSLRSRTGIRLGEAI